MKTNRIIAVIAFVLCTWTINAQIGYQVSLLNSATGEPRANETVNVTVQITNSESAVICSETKSARTDDFGVLSLQVGTENTFKNVDWSKLPLYISATVDGIMVGKSQILNVPVAEAAKKLVPVIQDIIGKTFTRTGNVKGYHGTESYTFSESLTYNYHADYVGVCCPDDCFPCPQNINESGTYSVVGHTIIIQYINNEGGNEVCEFFIYNDNKLYGFDNHVYHL